jgi:hypothetical protein
MRPHCLLLMLLPPCLILAGSLAVADDQPPKNQGSGLPAKTDKRLDNQEFEKRLKEQLSADPKENDRLYQKMAKGDPKDARVWLLFGWNAAYNVSVESKDVGERYGYAKQGIERLVEGLGHDPTNAELYSSVGFFLKNRFGQMDDRKAFRDLFRKDKEFHKFLANLVELKAVDGPDGLPDSFLVAQRWDEKTIAIFEKHGEPKNPIATIIPLMLYAYPAGSQRQYAMAIEGEGHFGEAAGAAWKRALKMWDDFGEREFVIGGMKVRLKDSEPGRAQMNYDYWIKRCQAEQTQAVLAARQASYRVLQHVAKQPSDSTDEERLQTKKFFDEAIGAWAKVDKEHPWLVDKDSGVEELISRYSKRVLKGKPLPDDFPFKEVAKRWPQVP